VRSWDGKLVTLTGTDCDRTVSDRGLRQGPRGSRKNSDLFGHVLTVYRPSMSRPFFNFTYTQPMFYGLVVLLKSMRNKKVVD
jgi:hypothetical protein